MTYRNFMIGMFALLWAINGTLSLLEADPMLKHLKGIETGMWAIAFSVAIFAGKKGEE